MIVAAAADGAAGVGVAALFVVYGLLILSMLVGYGLGIWALIDLSSKPDWAWQRSGQSKTTYLVLIVVGFVACQLLSLITAIVYLTSIRKRLDVAIAQGPPAYPYGYYAPQAYAPQPAYPQPGYGQQPYAQQTYGQPGSGYPSSPAQPGTPPPTAPAAAGWTAPGQAAPGQVGPGQDAPGQAGPADARGVSGDAPEPGGQPFGGPAADDQV